MEKCHRRVGIRDARGTICMLIMAVICVPGPGPAWAEPGFETPPVLEAVYFVAPWALKGPRYRIDDKVPTDGFQARFTISSDFGKFEALGADLLATRLAEVVALDKLESVSKTETFVKAAAGSVALPFQAVGSMLLNPMETVSGLPAGVGRLFERAKLGGQRVAEVAMDPVKGAADTAGAIGQIPASALGWEQERRRLAKELRVDPYTTNPVLAKRLDDIAWVSFSARLGVNVISAVTSPFSLAATPTSATPDLVWDTPANDLIILNEKKLRAMGVGDAAVRAFFKNRNWSLSGQTALVVGLEGLSGVAGRPDVVALATTAASGNEARFLIWAVQILNHHQENAGAIAAVQALGRTLIARVLGGGLLVAAPVDYVSWTKRLDEFARRPELQAVAERSIWLSGRLSPRAKQELATLGWITKEDVLPVK